MRCSPPPSPRSPRLKHAQGSLLPLLLATLTALGCGTARPVESDGARLTSTHDSTWWQAQREQQFPAPPAAELDALVEELCVQLANPDPAWREHVAVDGLTAWAYRAPVLDTSRKRALVQRLCANLVRDIGHRGDDSVLERSFSALVLSTLAAADNQQPFLSAAEHDALCTAAFAYLRDELDVRGYDERVGWRHSVAHTADLLKFVARSAQFSADEQRRLLEAIRAKLRAPSTGVLAWGEPERLAKALLSVVRRDDFDRAAFAAWAGALASDSKALWETQPLDPGAFRAVQNQRDVLAALASLLAAVDGENAQAALEIAVRALWK
jgi:hypothetical protein